MPGRTSLTSVEVLELFEANQSITFDRRAYMTSGRGRYATADNIPLVQEFFARGHELPVGIYDLTAITQQLGLPEFSWRFSQSLAAGFDGGDAMPGLL